MPHKVLVIDRSAVMRRELGRLIAAAPDLRLVAAVPDVHCAVLRAQVDVPDVLVLEETPNEVELRALLDAGGGPRTAGVVVLPNLDAQAPQGGSAPVSSRARAGHHAVRGVAVALITMGPRLLDSIRRAAAASRDLGTDERCVRANPSPFGPAVAPVPCQVHVSPKLSADVVLPPPSPMHHVTRAAPIVAIGTSTGGTQALETVLTALPADAPPIVIVQHMPERFTAAFASRLDGQCAIEVREARHHDRVTPGCALIAPGGRHMVLRANGTRYHVEIVDAPPVNRHRPSVDVLFRSVASVAERNALGIIMTGMGDDGAQGLREMRDAGARTLAQDEASCTVYGMPREAVRLGAVEASMSLDALAAAIKAHH